MVGELRRLFSAAWKPVALAGGLALVDAFWEPTRLKVTRVELPVNDWSDQLAGVRLAHLSDLHVGGTGWWRDTIARAVESCNRAEVDLVAITGDLIGSAAGPGPALELLSALRSDRPRFAVLGNHDHVHGGRPLQELLEGLDRLGIVVLRNQVASVESPVGRLWVAGVDDGYSMRDNLGRVRLALGPDDFPRLLLTHYPDIADWLRPGEFQLSLAGHSHGGQIRLPILSYLASNLHARTKYQAGLFRVNGNLLYVTPGLGVSGIPLRFRNWPELATLRFVHADVTGGRGVPL